MKRRYRKKKNRKGDLDIIVFLCVVAGLIMTVAPLILWFIQGEFMPDAYFQYGFHFWGSELIATVAVYWLKTKKKKKDESEAGTEDFDGTVG